jgi:hypothetical protein
VFSYAGISLGDVDGTVPGAWINANIRPQSLFPLAYQTWASQPVPPCLSITPEVPRPVQIGSLFWPRGASRFARGYFVVGSQQANDIRKAVFTDGAQESAAFIFDDGTTQIETDLWTLPMIPLSQAVPDAAALGAEMSLLVLVDDRYWWWGQSVSLNVLTGTTEWSDLYDAIGNSLEIDISSDPVADAYGMPTTNWNTKAQPLPLVLDALAFNIGQRIVRDLDGNVSAENSVTSLAIMTANLALGQTKYAGGIYKFST